MAEGDVRWSDGDLFGLSNSGDLIAQVDRAIHPDGKNLILLLEKSRGDPGTKPQRDHILSRSITRGRLNKDLGIKEDEPAMNALESLLFADAINWIADQGMSRDELLQGIMSAQTFSPRRGQPGGDSSAGAFGQ